MKAVLCAGRFRLGTHPRTQLDATAPANLSAAAGTVYYLNGQNNDLGYEKEIKDNGLIQHKHYLSAGGMVFALQVTRTGNLATGGTGGSAKPAQSLQYLHADHLGSVAVVTDDSGSVIERLAFDPWGKRRFFNGTADSHDSIVGLTLDRGYPSWLTASQRRSVRLRSFSGHFLTFTSQTSL